MLRVRFGVATNMKVQSALVWIVVPFTLGSGLVNLFSLIGPSLPERTALLKEVFPLEFLHLSRFLILITDLLSLSLLSTSTSERRGLFNLYFFLRACQSFFT